MRRMNLCFVVIIVIVLFILALATATFVMWETSSNLDKPFTPINMPNATIDNIDHMKNATLGTMDKFTYSQYSSAHPEKSSTSTIKASDDSILGDYRQLFLTPPQTKPSNALISDGVLKYEYEGNNSNGFEVRWLSYVHSNPEKLVVNLKDVEKFNVEVSSLNLHDSQGTFTLQMNVVDANGLESSVVSIVHSPKTVSFDQSSFIGNEPGQRPDFSRIVGVWLGGDFRNTGGKIVIHPLTFIQSS